MSSGSGRSLRRARACPGLLLLVAACLLIGACGDDAEEGPTSEALSEAEALQRILGDDQTSTVLEEVDGLVLDRRPVRAAEFLRSGALPAAHQQLEALEAFTPNEPTVRSVQRDLVRIQGSRIAALEQYAELLSRGGDVEDLAYVECLGEQRRIEETWVDAVDALSELRPLSESSHPRAARVRAPGGPGE